MGVYINAVLTELSTPWLLALRDWDAAIGSTGKLRLSPDASRDGFSDALERPQPVGSVRSITSINRPTLYNQRKWFIVELETRAFVRATKHLSPCLFQMELIVYSDKEALKNLVNVGQHISRYQRSLESLTLLESKYRWDPAHADAEFLSWLPRPAANEDCITSFLLTEAKHSQTHPMGLFGLSDYLAFPISPLGVLHAHPPHTSFGGIRLISHHFEDLCLSGPRVHLPLVPFHGFPRSLTTHARTRRRVPPLLRQPHPHQMQSPLRQKHLSCRPHDLEGRPDGIANHPHSPPTPTLLAKRLI